VDTRTGTPISSCSWSGWSPPTEADRAAAISAVGGDLVTLYPVEEGVWSDAWKIGRRDGAPFMGIEVDMSHCLVDTVASYPLEEGRSRAAVTALVEETHDLVEAHLPEIDVDRLREILRYERPLWDG
jgi:hypothetical protein